MPKGADTKGARRRKAEMDEHVAFTSAKEAFRSKLLSFLRGRMLTSGTAAKETKFSFKHPAGLSVSVDASDDGFEAKWSWRHGSVRKEGAVRVRQTLSTEPSYVYRRISTDINRGCLDLDS